MIASETAAVAIEGNRSGDVIMQITVPLPPSANRLTRNTANGGRAKTKPYAAWLEDAEYIARMAHRAAGCPRFAPPLALTLKLGLADRRRDAGNCLKPIEDMLVRSIEGLPDDRWNDDLRIVRDASAPTGAAVIELRSLADTS